MQVTDGASISASTFGAGNAGDFEITAQEIELAGLPIAFPTGLFAAVGTTATGQGGNLTITTEHLQVREGAQVSAGTNGAGDAGDITITATQVDLVGTNAFGSSGLFANALIGTGSGGNINVFTDQLNLTEGGTISASNFQSVGTVVPGQGPAGNIQVQATDINLDQQAMITAAASVGDFGNITLEADIVSLNEGSAVTTDAQNLADGGNISITSDVLLLRGNSNITANAVQGTGGNIDIATEGLFVSPDSEITASSELGINGVVEINTLETDPTNGFTTLPTNLWMWPVWWRRDVVPRMSRTASW